MFNSNVSKPEYPQIDLKRRHYTKKVGIKKKFSSTNSILQGVEVVERQQKKLVDIIFAMVQHFTLKSFEALQTMAMVEISKQLALVDLPKEPEETMKIRCY